ncbi:MAG: hypothetical protein Athens071426_266 [Parcubacteria group bacterium Athens0714_26]|nr:MAG: hypothetical protein Athens101426_195 [Parcubacteria group bacterium Athens1014_26]TSD03296.1 MAG: hypothetical protein Athens071426_266 [Parcubacteria group bacterium Athens0714_26]
MSHKIRILLTGGGSGGHIYPLIAVSQELKNIAYQNGSICETRYFGEVDFFSKVFTDNEIGLTSIISSKFRRYFSFKNFIDFFKLFLGFFEALWKVFWFMPDAAFSKGGPGALPVLFACKFYMIPIAIHESDSIPGLANIISGKLAKKVFVGFDSAAKYFSDKKDIEMVGNPIRRDLIVEQQKNYVPKEQFNIESRKGLGFDIDTPLILVLGGSLGATRINDFILENLGDFLRQFQILHQVGLNNYESYKKEFEFLSRDWSDIEKRRYQYRAYFMDDLINAYAACDLVLCRAGAGTIYELAYFGKPAILIPLLEAANNHQIENARQYSETGAAMVMEQENFLGHLVIEKIADLINNKDVTQKMSLAAKGFYKADAAKNIAQGILEIGS